MGSGNVKPKKVASAPASEQLEKQTDAKVQEDTAVLASSPDGCTALRDAICDLEANSPAASDLQMSSLMIEDAGIVKLAQVLPKSMHVQIMNLSTNRLTDVAAEALAAALPSTKLKVLLLERNSLTAVGVAALAKALPPTLIKLALGRNTVGLEGARALADSVVQLHTLILGFSQLNPEGAQALTPILSKVTVLDVSGNHLGAQGCSFLADKLEGSTLETLKLESNGVGDSGAKALAAALGRSTKLQMLEVRRNSVTDVGAEHLALGLEKNRTLRHLDLFDNSITDVGASRLLAAARKVKQSGSMLSKLDLEINDVSSSITTQIAEALRK